MNEYHILNNKQFQANLKKLVKETIAEQQKEEIWIDPETDLAWQVSHSENRMNWSEAKLYCGNLEYSGYSDWRLPTIKELISLIDFSKCNPACKIDAKSYQYWSATNDQSTEQFVWYADFYCGEIRTCNEANSLYVRAVRGWGG